MSLTLPVAHNDVAATRPATHAPHRRRPTPEPAETGGHLASVSKALMLLDIMRSAPGPVGVSMLARDAGMPKSTTFRLLAYLEQSGFVERAGKAYQLGWRLFELGNHVEHCRPSGLREIALPYLADLHARTGMNVHLAVLSGTDVVYLEKIHGLRSIPIGTSVGTRMPATISALGKAMLAYADRATLREVFESGLEGRTPYSLRQPGQLIAQLRETRETGVAYDREESQLGINCVAAPIHADGEVIAALSVCGPTRPVSAEAHADLVRVAARDISRQLTLARAC